jgi:RNA polymerase sigma factor (sigma-70 family)
MIDVTKHKGIIFQIARKVKNVYPSIEIQDIEQEIRILIMKYSSPISEGERRTVCYDASKSEESTFITTFIGTKILQTIKYSGLIDCSSCMIDGKQDYEYMKADYFSSITDKDEEMQLGETLQVVDGFNSMFNNHEDSIDIEETLSNLDEKEKKVISLRYIENSLTLKEIGEKLNLSNERIRQIEEKALAKLRKNSKLKELISA